MVGRKEMDGKRLQREMMERRRDEEVHESVQEEAEQTRFTTNCEEKHMKQLQYKVYVWPFYCSKSAAHSLFELSCNYYKQMRPFSR